ncbi:response regulator [Henriciella litoralis]|uniref:response regulator n=1 Tax=Henriciella litoralis TaxID=568102 RepID=UPI000A0232E1|nr:response regulator [Henriciella litoralis]
MIEATLERELPDLRRFSRALTGTQEAGDALVSEAVRLLSNRSQELVEHFCSRPRLFGLVSSILDSRTFLAFNPERADSPGRRAVLMQDVFGFTEEDARSALQLASDNYRMLLQAARLPASGLEPARIVILEDQFLIAADEEILLKSHGHDVVGVCATAEEALEIVKSESPDIVICDIDLGAGNPTGLDFAKSVPPEARCAFVFVTGHPATLCQGHPGEPAYLVSKPYDPAVLATIVYQALLNVRNPSEPLAGTSDLAPLLPPV